MLYPFPVVPTCWTAGGLCLPTSKCSRVGELLATGQLSISSPNHDHTHPTCLQTAKLCLPLYSLVHKQKAFCFTNLIGVGDLPEDRFPDIGPMAYTTNFITFMLYFVMIVAPQHEEKTFIKFIAQMPIGKLMHYESSWSVKTLYMFAKKTTIKDLYVLCIVAIFGLSCFDQNLIVKKKTKFASFAPSELFSS